MAASVNKAIIVGHLGRDPEIRYMPSGDAAANFSVATSESWKDKATGEKREATEWHNVSAFGKLAEICDQYLKKGSLVYIEGSLRTRKYTDRNGVEKYTTEIKADNMRMLGGRPDSEQRQPAAQPQQRPAPQPAQQGGFADMDDDIPFIDPMKRRVMSFVM